MTRPVSEFAHNKVISVDVNDSMALYLRGYGIATSQKFRLWIRLTVIVWLAS